MDTLDKNVVFIGMPGSGKTSIGRLTAERLGLGFYDVDEYIEKEEGRGIREIFKEGEDEFRKIESDAIRKLSRKSSSVISTGGGAVKKPENMEALKENSIIIFLNRPLENIIKDIDVPSRPLLAGGVSRIYELYGERYHLYKKFSDYEVQNDAGFEEVVEKIVSIVENSFDTK